MPKFMIVERALSPSHRQRELIYSSTPLALEKVLEMQPDKEKAKDYCYIVHTINEREGVLHIERLVYDYDDLVHTNYRTNYVRLPFTQELKKFLEIIPVTVISPLQLSHTTH